MQDGAVCMQGEIAKQHTEIVHEIEQIRTQVSYGQKWVEHAESRNACKVCSRPFVSPSERQSFVKRFASAEYAGYLILPFPNPCCTEVWL